MKIKKIKTTLKKAKWSLIKMNEVWYKKVPMDQHCKDILCNNVYPRIVERMRGFEVRYEMMHRFGYEPIF